MAIVVKDADIFYHSDEAIYGFEWIQYPRPGVFETTAVASSEKSDEILAANSIMNSRMIDHEFECVRCRHLCPRMNSTATFKNCYAVRVLATTA